MSKYVFYNKNIKSIRNTKRLKIKIKENKAHQTITKSSVIIQLF